MKNKVMAWDCYRKGEDDLIDFQSIEEKLLRLAVKWTDNYATDINIMINSLKDYFDMGADQVSIGFRQYGVDWSYLNGNRKIGEVGMEVHNLYRGRAKIVREGKDITLTWERGDC